MNKRTITTLIIAILTIVILGISILDKPDITHDAFSILVISWIFYETLNQRTDIQRIKDTLKSIQEVINKWQAINSQNRLK